MLLESFEYCSVVLGFSLFELSVFVEDCVVETSSMVVEEVDLELLFDDELLFPEYPVLLQAVKKTRIDNKDIFFFKIYYLRIE